MMIDNEIQFAVVREDPLVEKEILLKYLSNSILTIGSGGCTALALKAWHPDARLTILDTNPAELALIRKKIDAIKTGAPFSAFNVADENPANLSQCGNFESLFRIFRNFVQEFCLSKDHIQEMFVQSDAYSTHCATLIRSPYWPAAFDLCFSDSLLETMFGENAIQYAESGSYPRYFRELVERGLAHNDGPTNPFLHHIFLGFYLPSALPEFLKAPPNQFDIQWISGGLNQVDFGDFDFIGLSNIFDWMPTQEVEEILRRIRTESRPNCTVLWRQLNNNRSLHLQLTPVFQFDHKWEKALQEKDRSLFYSSIHVGHRHL
jgi:S-adenosylmethionine-diacylglycerol 3-amino-3-carboxypropyl transferase